MGFKVLLLEGGVCDDVAMAMAMAMMVHPAPEEACALPTLAVTDLRLRYHGKAAHAATAPHRGINAADALTVAQVSVGLRRQHLEAKQMIHGIVTGGGAAPNIAPARTAATYYLRAADVESLRLLEGRVRGCFEAYRAAITALGRTPLRPEPERHRQGGSTDMGNVTQVLPGIHPQIAIDSGGAVNDQPEFASACVTASADAAVLDGAALAATAVAAATEDDQRERLLAGVATRRAATRGAA